MQRILLALLVLVSCSPLLVSQTNNQQQDFYSQLYTLKNKARTAYNAEMQREKDEQSGNYQQPSSGGNLTVYLKKELETTTANYQAYVRALRSAEALDQSENGERYSRGFKLPSKTSNLKEFDKVESMFQEFRKLQCTAAYDANLEGSIAPVVAQACELELMRNHMHELEHIYQFLH